MRADSPAGHVPLPESRLCVAPVRTIRLGRPAGKANGHANTLSEIERKSIGWGTGKGEKKSGWAENRRGITRTLPGSERTSCSPVRTGSEKGTRFSSPLSPPVSFPSPSLLSFTSHPPSSLPPLRSPRPRLTTPTLPPPLPPSLPFFSRPCSSLLAPVRIPSPLPPIATPKAFLLPVATTAFGFSRVARSLFQGEKFAPLLSRFFQLHFASTTLCSLVFVPTAFIASMLRLPHFPFWMVQGCAGDGIFLLLRRY